MVSLASSSLHLSRLRGAGILPRLVACLGLLKTEVPREDSDSNSHPKADEHELGMRLMKFQNGGTQGSDSILGCSSEK